MKQTWVLLLVTSLLISLTPALGISQTVAKTLTELPGIPQDYQKWPNVFQRRIQIDANTIVTTSWIKIQKTKDLEVPQKLEHVITVEINKIPVSVAYIQSGPGGTPNPLVYIKTDINSYSELSELSNSDKIKQAAEEFPKYLSKVFGIKSFADFEKRLNEERPDDLDAWKTFLEGLVESPVDPN